MKKTIDPGKVRRSINFIDNIKYSTVRDLGGNPLDLMMSIMVQNGNSEMRIASGNDDEADTSPKPVILWIPGGGYRGCDKNLMVAEMQFLADAGYAVASIYYRSSAQGHFPDQIVDVKTAVRFLRAHASMYQLDSARIAVIGRSAGGHLAALAAMNTDNFESSEWAENSSKIQACCDLFGPIDLVDLTKRDLIEMEKNPNHRWKSILDTHAGALIGDDGPGFWDKLAAANVANYINERVCPILIMHGEKDPLVSYNQSENFYNALNDYGLGDQTDYVFLKNGGHGTREFFQSQSKEIILDFFDKYLKVEIEG